VESQHEHGQRHERDTIPPMLFHERRREDERQDIGEKDDRKGWYPRGYRTHARRLPREGDGLDVDRHKATN
jgi:hypothetical protein